MNQTRSQQRGEAIAAATPKLPYTGRPNQALIILLLGKNGRLGQALQRSLAPLGELVALGRSDADLAQSQTLLAALNAVQPDIIVNAAAYTAVDEAENEPELAYALNALAPGFLAAEAKKINAWLLHYSSDYVFDGAGQTAWLETDPVAPLNVYGASKLAGERLIDQSGAQYLIFRTSWVYAEHGKNFIRTILQLGQQEEKLQLINDQIGAPTSAELIADISAYAIGHISRKLQHSTDLGGIYHLTASGYTNWFDYAKYILAQTQLICPQFHIKTRQIEAIPSTSFASEAKRPRNSRLNSEKLKTTFKVQLPPWQSGVQRMLEKYLAQTSTT